MQPVSRNSDSISGNKISISDPISDQDNSKAILSGATRTCKACVAIGGYHLGTVTE